MGVRVWRVDAGVARGECGCGAGGSVWCTGVWVRCCVGVGAVRGV